jgi:guanine deaminase
MNLAAAEAAFGVRKNHGGPFGAVIVRRGKVVARAHNEVIKTCDPTAHAEIFAIRKASARLKTFDLSACELYATCEPCPMCLTAILWARIPQVYYGCTRRDADRIGFRDNLLYEQMRIKMGAGGVKLLRLGRRQCLMVFREWANKRNKVPY